VKDPIQTILSETNNRMDILVKNAGYVLFGAFEDLSMDEVRSLYETNVFGVIRVTQARYDQVPCRLVFRVPPYIL
jgi:short-subunit dehydrogenase